MSNDLKLLIGLHLTKCAGTSLMTTLRRVLTDDEYCFESSFAENFKANRMPFGSWRETELLRIYFGHFMHEYHLGLFRDRNTALFTGVREPVSRAVSALRQINSVRARGEQALLSAEEFLGDTGHSMIGEVLRAFPSVARQYSETVPAALAALSLMDFIYSTENFDQESKWIFANLDLDLTVTTDNEASLRQETAAESAIVTECRAMIQQGRSAWLSADIEVYETIKPFIAKGAYRDWIAGQPWIIDRPAFLDALPDRETCRRRLQEMEAGYLAWEFSLLGMTDYLIRTLDSEIDAWKRMIEAARQYA